MKRRPLNIDEIIFWATAHREATGKPPTKSSGSIVGAKFESWAGVDQALREGLRGLPGGSSLAQLLAERLGIRNIHGLAPLTEAQILQWADEHHQRTGEWPTRTSGLIPGSNGDMWKFIDSALRFGSRGLQTRSSLAKLLAEHRGKRNRKQLPPLTEEQILTWADVHCHRTGAWPTISLGPIEDAPGETWLAVDMALRHGWRGLPPGSSLAQLIAQNKGARNYWSRPDLSVGQILTWADAHFKSTGSWPHLESGAIPESGGETWNAINHALKKGSRGLQGETSLAELLASERGVRNRTSVPGFTRKQILEWADAYHHRLGHWPTRSSGPILEAPDETWHAVDAALRTGGRGLKGDSSLPRLLATYRNRRNHLGLAPLSQKKILAWADAHFARTGIWPNINSGVVHEAPGERWDWIDNSLRQGHRGLAGGSSLSRLLARKRGLISM